MTQENMYRIQRHVIEKLVRRELTESEWSKLQKADNSDIYNWSVYHSNDKKNT